MRRARFLNIQFRKIQKDANKSAKLKGREVCGLIVDKGRHFELIQPRNKSKRGGGFSFYFSEVRTVQKTTSESGDELVGTFHSHPIGLSDPGPSDLENAVNESIMLIFDVIGKSARLWFVKDRKARRMRFSLI